MPSSYTAGQTLDHEVPIVFLKDKARDVEVRIAPSSGNRAYEMLIGGKNILYFPYPDVRGLQGNRQLNGIPFLAPWANRIPDAFRANGQRYAFNADLNCLRLDQNGTAIHGMLTSAPFWDVISVGADETSAYATSRLEFWKYPDLMANWPFAHDYEMTYRLSSGVLEVMVAMRNMSAAPMPVALGFHPYFQLPGVAIEQAHAHIAALAHVETDDRLLATGETRGVRFPERVPLKDQRFDDGFTDLARRADGRAEFYVEGGGKRITVEFGPLYRVAIIYAPAGHDFICFEPMAAITNGINLAAEGKYPDLQTVAPGETWKESFWIRADGF